jgi:hypothetical protein
VSLPSSESIFERRTNLALQIARQRGELAEAYRAIAKPIHYAEYGMRGFGFLRKNSWVIPAVPAVLSIASTLWGLKKKISAKPSPRQRQSIESRPKGIVGHAAKWGGHGWRLFKLYRRVRRYFP